MKRQLLEDLGEAMIVMKGILLSLIADCYRKYQYLVFNPSAIISTVDLTLFCFT